MNLLTKEQAQKLDRIAISFKQMAIPGVELMGKAGSEVAEYVQNMIAGIANPKIAIICGKGNNAGDGYKAAIDLYKNGLHPYLIIASDKKEIEGDSLFYYKQCVKNNISITHSSKPPTEKYDLIVDALLGTGFTGELRTPILEYTKWINKQKSLVLSVDIPTGVNANNGNVAKHTVNADVTITMGMAKVGMAIEPGKSLCGDIIPVDIGFPDIYNELPGSKYRMADEDLAYKYLRAPDINTYKHRQGKVLIIAGSCGMTGAAILASNGAMRSGVGLVKVFAPKSLNNIYEANIIEGLTICCEDDGKGFFTLQNYSEIEKYFDWSDTILIGPGLGLNKSTKELVKKVVTNYTKPLIIDADGLSIFNDNVKLFRDIKGEFIITPHYGEFASLLNTTTKEIIGNITDYLEKFMNGFEGTLVAKNAPTFISYGKNIVINSTGNQGLATGGAGDVLTGVIASFAAQGIPSNIAAELGVFIHGKAADLVAEQKGYRGMIASDLLGMLPKAIMTYE